LSYRHLPRLVLAAAVAAGIVGCDRLPQRVITVASTPGVREGERTQVTITVHNVLPHPIIPIALTLYVRQDPTEYFVLRHLIGETEYYQPLQATEVRHLQTLSRIEADHVRDGNTWRRVPDSRFLHPRIVLPGKTLSETFQFQAYEPYQRLLFCDLHYLPVTPEHLRGCLFARSKPAPVAPHTERYTEHFTRIDEANLQDPDPDPQAYLLFRPRRLSAPPPRLITRRIPIHVRPRDFSYATAARRARFGARTHCYFRAADTWVFEYPDDGTWFIGPVATTKLQGHYVNLIADLELRDADQLTLTASRDPQDKLLQLFQKAGYSDPQAKDPQASAAIPTDNLLPVLQQAEALGYTIDPRTWKRVD
jgi:hypothetical protein